MQRAQEDHLTGTVLEGRYVVGPRMARGGTGGVYRAVDRRLERTVAVKIMHPHLSEDPDFVGRFAKEARAAAQLSHPHVVAVLDQGSTDDGLVYLVMEFVEGGTLRDVLNRKKFLTPGQAMDLLAPILDGLGSAHRAGLVHRDIKPENVLMRTDATVKVADFGLSRGADQHTATGAVLGTVAYAAPELVKEESVGKRSDVYSMGILAWEMLAGKRPFQGSPWMLARAHAEDPVPALTEVVPGIDVGISDLLQRWTAKDPQQRPADAATMADELARLRATLDEDALRHIPDTWEQGPGPLAPVLADPGASVLPDSAPATGPVDELRDTGSLTARDTDATETGTGDASATEALPAAASHPVHPGPGGSTASPGSAGESESAPVTGSGSTRETSDEPVTEAMPGAAAASATRGTATAAISQTPPRNLGVYDDTTDMTALTAPAGDRKALNGSAGNPGDDSAEADATQSIWGKVANRLGGARTTTDSHGHLVEQPSNDPTRPTVRLLNFSALRVVVALAATALLICLAAFLGWFLGSGSFRTEVVPAVQGTTQEQAQALVEEQGFGNVRVYEEDSSSVPAGSVIGTQPQEGTQMRVGEQLSVMVSTGPAQVTVPSVEGLTQDEATSRLDNAGLTVGAVTTEFSDSEEGTVVASSPASSTQLNEGSSVNLMVSAGTEPTEVPSMVGSNVDDATTELEDLGFTVEREDVAGARLGRVIGQTQDGSTITLRVI